MSIKEGFLEVTEIDKKEVDEVSEKSRFLEGLELASNLGFTIAIPIVIGAVLGSFLDNKLNTSPKLTLSLIMLGLFISFYN
ncbi:AtpZ/AtpI family protein, partial [Candidatus Gottesmanbacteria bacterium]|nr:AtpZ/AtpI family protein [Candidatus Gottesmanbacteria bacterium]